MAGKGKGKKEKDKKRKGHRRSRREVEALYMDLLMRLIAERDAIIQYYENRHATPGILHAVWDEADEETRQGYVATAMARLDGAFASLDRYAEDEEV